MALQIDFMRDVAARCVERLVEAGYDPHPTDAEDAAYTYVSIRHRRVRPKPRRVHKAAYTVPAHLAEGERRLLEKVEAGSDLWPHQSRKIGKLAIEDGMLNDFGIQHFHLGTDPDPRHPNLIKGTKELLFALVRDDDFYAIGLFDHKAWTKNEVLAAVNQQWPDITEPFTLKDGPNTKIVGLSRTYTDEEAAKLRSAGINVLRQMPDGKVMLGPGGGIATDGSSVSVRRETDSLIIHTRKLQAAVLEGMEKEVPSGAIDPNATVRVVWRDGKTLVVTDPPSRETDITGHLEIPAL